MILEFERQKFRSFSENPHRLPYDLVRGLSTRPAARPLMTETRRRVVGTSRDASRALASALAMAAPAPASASLVRVDALDRVFDIIDANRDGSLTVQEFILVRPPASPRRLAPAEAVAGSGELAAACTPTHSSSRRLSILAPSHPTH